MVNCVSKMAPQSFVLVFAFASFLVLYPAVADTAEAPIVTYKDGSVQGNAVEITPGKSVHQFLGLPFAEPPIGKIRFAAPKPSKPWTGVREATKYGPSCPQNVVNVEMSSNASWESKGLGKAKCLLSAGLTEAN